MSFFLFLRLFINRLPRRIKDPDEVEEAKSNMFNLLIIKDDLFCFYIKTEQQKVKHIKDAGLDVFRLTQPLGWALAFLQSKKVSQKTS